MTQAFEALWLPIHANAEHSLDLVAHEFSIAFLLVAGCATDCCERRNYRP